jgi:rhodanese-related sulfurtransferase
VAQFLNEHGYQAKALLGGFDAWKAGGYPTEPK